MVHCNQFIGGVLAWEEPIPKRNKMAVVRDKLDRKLTTRRFMEKYGIKE